MYINEKSPTLPTKCPAWHAGLRQSRGFFVKSRAEPPTGNAALYKGRSLSNIRPVVLLREAGWISLVLLYHNLCKKKSGRPESLPLLNCQSKSSKLIPRQNYYITHSAFFQCLSAGSLPPSGCNVSVLQCPAAGAAQRTAVRLSYGLPSQAVRF